MVKKTQNETDDWSPKKAMDITFSRGFKPLSSTDKDVDADDVGAILSVVDRLIFTAGNDLDLGRIRLMQSWGLGRGLNLNYQSDKIYYELREDISCWEDLDSENIKVKNTGYIDPCYPILYSRPEFNLNFMSINGVESYGIKNTESNKWDDNFSHDSKSNKALNKLCEELQKIDVIFKTQLYPRSRLCLNYKHGHLLMFVNNKDHLIIFINQETGGDNFSDLTRLGECFILT